MVFRKVDLLLNIAAQQRNGFFFVESRNRIKLHCKIFMLVRRYPQLGLKPDMIDNRDNNKAVVMW